MGTVKLEKKTRMLGVWVTAREHAQFVRLAGLSQKYVSQAFREWLKLEAARHGF
jgi:hypothetical protein